MRLIWHSLLKYSKQGLFWHIFVVYNPKKISLETIYIGAVDECFLVEILVIEQHALDTKAVKHSLKLPQMSN
jgi:hypothetical protein